MLLQLIDMDSISTQLHSHACHCSRSMISYLCAKKLVPMAGMSCSARHQLLCGKTTYNPEKYGDVMFEQVALTWDVQELVNETEMQFRQSYALQSLWGNHGALWSNRNKLCGEGKMNKLQPRNQCTIITRIKDTHVTKQRDLKKTSLKPKPKKIKTNLCLFIFCAVFFRV